MVLILNLNLYLRQDISNALKNLEPWTYQNFFELLSIYNIIEFQNCEFIVFKNKPFFLAFRMSPLELFLEICKDDKRLLWIAVECKEFIEIRVMNRRL